MFGNALINKTFLVHEFKCLLMTFDLVLELLFIDESIDLFNLAHVRVSIEYILLSLLLSVNLINKFIQYRLVLLGY